MKLPLGAPLEKEHFKNIEIDKLGEFIKHNNGSSKTGRFIIMRLNEDQSFENIYDSLDPIRAISMVDLGEEIGIVIHKMYDVNTISLINAKKYFVCFVEPYPAALDVYDGLKVKRQPVRVRDLL